MLPASECPENNQSALFKLGNFLVLNSYTVLTYIGNAAHLRRSLFNLWPPSTAINHTSGAPPYLRSPVFTVTWPLFKAVYVNPKIKLAANVIHAGGVIAYPTEAVWGLGCDPFNAHAVSQILQLKKRSPTKGVILIASDMAQLEFLLHDLPTIQRQTLMQSWPGPFTWLVPHHHRVPPFIHGLFDTVAVRVSAHPTVKALCHAVGGPIVSTSANPQGLPPATTQLKARAYFGQRISYCPGMVGKNAKPSKIQDLTTGAVVRPA